MISSEGCMSKVISHSYKHTLCHGSPVSPPPTQSPCHIQFQSAPYTHL